MRRFSLLAFVFFISLSLLPGQEDQETGVPEDAVESENQETADKPAPFPLGPILVSALQKGVPWRPDWGLAMPPDAFRLVSGRPLSITLTINEEKYRVLWDRKGALLEFPLALNGVFVQVQAVFRSSGAMQSLIITGAEPPRQIDFIGKEVPLSLARVTQDGTVCFVALRYDPVDIAETWYDQEGTALAGFISRSRYTRGYPNILTLESRYEGKETSEWYYYDSFGNISEIQAPGAVFSVLYSREQHPRYWKRRIFDASNPDVPALLENYTLQWDEQGLLVRMAGISGRDDSDAADFRYEYTLDSRGNWIERREIRMIRRLGVLVSSPGLTVKRVITYRTGA
ncbi:MAG: hypothetical protein LBD55_08065 [Treponema sp.]|jgi:hypothetical protein|nr:hypothetical protein [Treponema sp.]